MCRLNLEKLLLEKVVFSLGNSEKRWPMLILEIDEIMKKLGMNVIRVRTVLLLGK